MVGRSVGGRSVRGRIRPGRRQYALTAAVLCAAWGVPALCALAGVTFVLPVLIWLLTASLLRGGRDLMDRLLLALVGLFGATTAAGLLFSVWPWGLDPVPVAGTALTVLAGVAVVTGRRPRLPRPGLSDLVLTCAAGMAAGVVAWPLLWRGAADRLAILAFLDDFARHFSLFEGIRSGGGYVFVHPDQVSAMVQVEMHRYPQGSHLVYALLDTSLRGDATLGPIRTAIDHYAAMSVAGFFLLALASVWATRWIGGPWLAGWRYLVPVTAIAGYCGFGELVYEFAAGHTSETAGAALAVALVALLSRPLRQVREQLVLLSVLLIGIGFTYYLYLPAAGLAVLGWLVAYRHRVRPVWRTALGCGLVTAVLASVIPVLGLLAGQAAALQVGPGLKISREFVGAMALVVLAGLVSPQGRRSPALRGYTWAAGCVVGFSGALYTYQKIRFNVAGYYFEKTMTLTAVVVMVGLAAVAALLPVPQRVRPPASRLARLSGPLPSLFVALAILVSLGQIRGDSPYRSYYGYATTYGAWFAKGSTLSRQPVVNANRAYAAIGNAKGSPVMFLMPSDRGQSYFSTLYLATLMRNLGTSRPLVPSVFGVKDPAKLDPVFAKVSSSAELPVRVVIVDQATANALADLERRRPDLHLVVYRLYN